MPPRCWIWRRAWSVKLIKIQISLTDEQLANVQLIAELRGWSVAHVFRWLLDRYENDLLEAIAALEDSDL